MGVELLKNYKSGKELASLLEAPQISKADVLQAAIRLVSEVQEGCSNVGNLHQAGQLPATPVLQQQIEPLCCIQDMMLLSPRCEMS
eukprot:1159159-Pelagomonas_calceolata.AAC.4